MDRSAVMIVARGGAAAFLACACPATAVAGEPPRTAEQAIAVERHSLYDVIAPSCRPGAEEIVVCGRKPQGRERVPFPDQRVDGSRTHLLPGEPPSALAALRETDDPCSNVGPQPRCGGSVSFITVGVVLFKFIKHLADPTVIRHPRRLAPSQTRRTEADLVLRRRRWRGNGRACAPSRPSRPLHCSWGGNRRGSRAGRRDRRAGPSRSCPPS